MALVGIVTGLVGSVATNVFSWLVLKENNKYAIAKMAHEAKLWTHEQELVVLQSQGKVSEFEAQNILEQVKGSMAGLSASIKAQMASAENASKRANSVLMFFRPLLTFILLLATFYFTKNMLDDDFSKAAYAVIAIIDLSSMSVSWWFGDRSSKRGLEIISSAGRVRGAAGDF